MALGKSVAWYLSGSSSWYSDSTEAFATVIDGSISDCSANNARSDEIVFCMPFSAIATDSVVDNKMMYGPSLLGSNLKYESGVITSLAVTENGGRPTQAYWASLKCLWPVRDIHDTPNICDAWQLAFCLLFVASRKCVDQVSIEDQLMQSGCVRLSVERTGERR